MADPDHTPVAGVVITVLVLIVGAALLDGDESSSGPEATIDDPAVAVTTTEPDEVTAFENQLDIVLTDVDEARAELDEVELAWLEGAATDDELRALLDTAQPAYIDTINEVAALTPPSTDPGAVDRQVASLSLRLAALDLQSAALSDQGLLRADLARAARRLDVLADVVVGDQPVPQWDPFELAPTDVLGPAVPAQGTLPSADDIGGAPLDQLDALATQLELAAGEVTDRGEAIDLLLRAELARVHHLAALSGNDRLALTSEQVRAVLGTLG